MGQMAFLPQWTINLLAVSSFILFIQHQKEHLFIINFEKYNLRHIDRNIIYYFLKRIIVYGFK